MAVLRVFTAFSGYDSQCMALDRLADNYSRFKYKLVGWSEVDKYVIQAHDACFPEHKRKNFGDISKIDWAKVPDFDLFTYSSPCQDFSNAGNKAGGEKGSGTRSSLLWECERAIKAKKPRFLLMENVPSIERYPTFGKWLRKLEKLGYKNFYQVLDAKEFGVPQTRKRMFVVSILGSGSFKFPKPKRLKETMHDRLQRKVDAKYYFTQKRLRHYMQHNSKMENNGNKFTFMVRNPKEDIACCILAGQSRFTDNYIKGKDGRVRMLTPYEYLRFMDVGLTRCKKICNLDISDSQIYKMAGNSIVVSVLYYIFKELLITRH